MINEFFKEAAYIIMRNLKLDIINCYGAFLSIRFIIFDMR
jgi:hypothetical protein